MSMEERAANSKVFMGGLDMISAKEGPKIINLINLLYYDGIKKGDHVWC